MLAVHIWGSIDLGSSSALIMLIGYQGTSVLILRKCYILLSSSSAPRAMDILFIIIISRESTGC